MEPEEQGAPFNGHLVTDNIDYFRRILESRVSNSSRCSKMDMK
jgi:hypothetical protein